MARSKATVTVIILSLQLSTNRPEQTGQRKVPRFLEFLPKMPASVLSLVGVASFWLRNQTCYFFRFALIQSVHRERIAK